MCMLNYIQRNAVQTLVYRIIIRFNASSISYFQLDIQIVPTEHSQHFFDPKSLPVKVHYDQDEWTVCMNCIFERSPRYIRWCKRDLHIIINIQRMDDTPLCHSSGDHDHAICRIRWKRSIHYKYITSHGEAAQNPVRKTSAKKEIYMRNVWNNISRAWYVNSTIHMLK